MSCSDTRLDEYLDGELDAPARAAVEAHLAGCAACRSELDGSRRLDGLLLRAGPGGAAPDADRFLTAVRARARRRPLLPWAAAAAVLLAAVTAPFLVLKGRGGDPAALLADYAKTPTADLEARLLAGGLDAVERQLSHPDVRVQFAAAALLFRRGDERTRERVFHRLQAPVAPSDWVLASTGAEAEDADLVPVAISELQAGTNDAWPMDALRRLHHLNRRGRECVTDSVVALLKSDQPKVQRLALQIVKELEVDFPLAAVVELLESPELGAEALRVLRQATGKDLGRDRDAWLKALAPKEENP
jgi:hypothetical protein